MAALTRQNRALKQQLRQKVNFLDDVKIFWQGIINKTMTNPDLMIELMDSAFQQTTRSRSAHVAPETVATGSRAGKENGLLDLCLTRTVWKYKSTLFLFLSSSL